MLTIFQEEKVISICMFILMGLSLLTKLLLSSLYRRMIKEADNMATTENKLLKQCKLKFANCFQLNNGVSNIPIFVDKFLNRLAIGPISFETMYHMSGQMMMLSIVAAGVGICKCIVDGRMFGEILPFYIVSLLGLYIYFSLSSLVDIKGKKRVLKVNLIDYLENHLSARIHITEQDMEMLYGKVAHIQEGRNGKRGSRRTLELMPIGGRLSLADHENKNAVQDENTKEKEQNNILVEGLRKEVRKAAEASLNKESGEIFTKDQEKELEELLKEFLTS
jgi:hypothetical protein